MMTLWWLHLLLFAAVFTLWWGSASAVQRFLAAAPPPEPDRPANRLMRRLAADNQTGRFAAASARYERLLDLAGRPFGPVRGSEFVAQLQVLGVGLGLALFVIPFVLGAPLLVSLWLGAMGGAAGPILRNSDLNQRLTRRRLALTRRFPYFLDQCVMVMDAGATFLEAIEIFVQDNRGQPLAEEFAVLLHTTRMGRPLPDSLRALRERMENPEMQTTLSALLQGYRLGTPLSQILREQAETLRFRRIQNAEREAEELKVKLHLPTVLMMAAALLLLLAPALVNLSSGQLR